MHIIKAVIYLLLFFSLITVVSAENVTKVNESTKLSDKEVLKIVKSKFGISEYPKPTLELNDTAVYVLFRFGAWDRIAYNNTKAVAPLYVYAYSNTKIDIEWWTEKEGLNGTINGSWGFLGTIGKKGMRDTIYLKIIVNGEEHLLKIPLVKSIKEEEKEVVITFKKIVLERHGQAAIVLAVFGIITAYVIKRKTLLISTFNAINLVVVLGLTIGLGYYLEYVREDSTFWLAFVFAGAELTSYNLIPVGRKIWFMQILPSLRKVLVEEGVVYGCREGLAFAIQSIGEAIRRLKGEHILLKDKEINEIGKFSEDKMFKVIFNELEFCDAILTLSAKIRRLRHEFAKEKD